MLLTGIPTRFLAAFASQANVGDVTDPFPVIAQPSGLASLQTGFTPANFTPVSAGGIPPWGRDVNGILLLVTEWEQWQQAGGPIGFDAAFAAAVGGYPRGAALAAALGNGIVWISKIDSNTTDPDIDSTNWFPGVYRASSGRVNAGLATCYTYAGDPNTHLAGTAGTGSSPPDLCWDYLNAIMYACSLSGNAAGAHWAAVTFTPSTYTAHRVILGSGTSNFNISNAGTYGQPFISTGPSSDPAYGPLNLNDGNNSVANQLQPGWGGTGLDHLEFGAVLVGNNTSPINRVLADVGTGYPLLSVLGGIPQYGLLPANRVQRGNFYLAGPGAGSPTNGNFTVPFGVSVLKVRIWGGGGGGAGCLSSSVGYGGGGGGYVEAYLTVTPGEIIAYSIGQGGLGGGVGSNGSGGANTTFTSSLNSLFAGGGGSGGGINTGIVGGGGGASGGTLNIPGQEGGTFWYQGGPLSGLFVAAGGGGTHGTPPVRPGAGGRGGDGIFPGGGGGGGAGSSLVAYGGGNGAPGLLIVEW